METENPENPHPDKVIFTEENVNQVFTEEETIVEEKNIQNNTETEADQMEIHTHGHIHETKKWKEYLFQFIMLFLAISLSFLVENQREHYIEAQRAKVLAVSLIQNLKSDLNEAEVVTANSDTIIMNNNSVIAELNKPRELQNDSVIHRSGLQKIQRFNVFDSNSGTYEQVKNSGALRYFKPEIVSQLTSYETNRNYILKMSKLYLDFHSGSLEPFCLKNCNPKFIEAILNKKPIPNPVFINKPTPEFLNQIYNYALHLNRLNQQQILIVKRHSDRAKSLIKLISEEYHIDENEIKDENH